MKVEITRIQKVTVDIGPCKDEEIEQKVLDKYNSMSDSDFPAFTTEMSYKALPREAAELGVRYKLLDFAQYLIKYAYEKYNAIDIVILNVILYMMTEYYYKQGIKIFDDDFMSYVNYPRSKQLFSKYYMYVASMEIYPMSFQETKLSDKDIDEDTMRTLNRYLSEYADKNMFDIKDMLLDTVWSRMVCAGMKEETIVFL